MVPYGATINSYEVNLYDQFLLWMKMAFEAVKNTGLINVMDRKMDQKYVMACLKMYLMYVSAWWRSYTLKDQCMFVLFEFAFRMK